MTLSPKEQSYTVEDISTLVDGGMVRKVKGVRLLGLNPERGFDASHNKAPRFTCRKKTDFGDPMIALGAKEIRPGAQTYKIKDVTHNGPAFAPKWSMLARSSGISKPPQQPGPGQYEIPSTVYFENPLVAAPGRCPKRTEKRADPQDGMEDTPAPGYYKVNFDGEIGTKLQNKAPQWSMRIKPGDPLCREKRPNAQTYNVPSNATANGLVKPPKWSMTTRSSGISKPPMVPGPGEYPIPGTIYGGHPAFDTPGRVAILQGKRSAPSDGITTYKTRPY